MREGKSQNDGRSGRQSDGPEDVHTLTPGTCEHVTLQDKRNFAEVIKGMDLRIETLF